MFYLRFPRIPLELLPAVDLAGDYVQTGHGQSCLVISVKFGRDFGDGKILEIRHVQRGGSPGTRRSQRIGRRLGGLPQSLVPQFGEEIVNGPGLFPST